MPMSRPRFILLATLGTAAIAFGAVGIFNYVSAPDPICLHQTPSGRDPDEVIAGCEQRLLEADRKASEVVSRRADDFLQFIDSKKSGAKPFAKAVVSFYGKWRAIKSRLPFTETDGHRQYVEETFDKHIFTKEELADAVRLAVEGTLRDLEGIENELAVALREEVLGRPLAQHEVPVAAAEFSQAIDKIIVASQHDAAKAGASLAVSEIAAALGGQILVRLGVSAGILAASAANYWWTLGASVVIGLIVDALWDWVDDPQGDIERATIAELDKIAVNGSAAIREEMQKAAEQKRAEWREAALGSES